jgi:hypothetical protein
LPATKIPNDHEGLSRDPAMRALIGKRALDRTAVSSGTVSRFETDMLTQDENIEALSSLNSSWVSNVSVGDISLQNDGLKSPLTRSGK